MDWRYASEEQRQDEVIRLANIASNCSEPNCDIDNLKMAIYHLRVDTAEQVFIICHMLNENGKKHLSFNWVKALEALGHGYHVPSNSPLIKTYMNASICVLSDNEQQPQPEVTDAQELAYYKQVVAELLDDITFCENDGDNPYFLFGGGSEGAVPLAYIPKFAKCWFTGNDPFLRDE